MNNNIKNKESKKVNHKEWKQFKSNYTFLILGLLIYSLRPLRINKNSNELSYALEILNKSLNKENYKEELNLILRFITSQFVKIESNAREKIIEKSSTKSKMLDVLKLLLNVNSFTDFYTKIIKYEFGLTDNKDFFNFISSLIHFEDSQKSKSLNSDTRSKYVIFLIKRVSNSPLNSALGNLNKNNIIYDEKMKKYKNFLINVASEFFKNMVKNNKVEFINSKIVLKQNINTIPTNQTNNRNQTNNKRNKINIKENESQSFTQNSSSTSSGSNLLNNSLIKKNILVSSPSESTLTQNVKGGNKNKSKSKSINFKDMWWLKKYE
jgi:hypothetical protein